MGKALKNKIFAGMFLLAIICIISSVGIASVMLYKNAEKEIKESNEVEAQYLIYFLNKYGEDAICNIDTPNNRRITLIDKEGIVLYDSKADSVFMENHRDRPEVVDALKYGEGINKRLSGTMEVVSYYYAIKLESGNVLRLSIDSDSAYESFKSVMPGVLVLAVVIMILAVFVARAMTKLIVKPINNIDIKEPEKNAVYDELSPFISRIWAQNKVIENQMKDLRKKQIEFETVTNNMREGLLVIGKDGRVLSYNNSALELLGVNWQIGEMSGILEFNRSQIFEKTINMALAGKNEGCILNIEDKVCQVLANGLRDDEKNKGAIVIIIDITEKEKREALRREFSANVSHELKTPLTSISGYAEIMKSGIAKSEDMVRFSEIIYTEARRLIDLVGDIIKLSKLDEGKTETEKININLLFMVKDIEKRLYEYGKSKKVKVELFTDGKSHENYETETVPHMADEIIYNILDNAIKYNKENGEVSINISESSEYVNVMVKDTGIGIPKEDMGRVFERFYRVDKSRSKAENGTGLGLSIVKHNAANLGVEIEVESVLGEGTTVDIIFPKKH